jgi:hypothetical protein
MPSLGATPEFSETLIPATGFVQVAGAVVRAADSALFTVLSESQEQRVLMVWEGPF